MSQVQVSPVSTDATSKSGKAAHATEIARLAQEHESGKLIISKGEGLSHIAQAYAKANDISFERAFKGLMVANPSAFADAQHNLIIGASFVVPLKEDVLKAAETGVFTAMVLPEQANDNSKMVTQPEQAASVNTTVVPQVTTTVEVSEATTGTEVNTAKSTSGFGMLSFDNQVLWLGILVGAVASMLTLGLYRYFIKWRKAAASPNVNVLGTPAVVEKDFTSSQGDGNVTTAQEGVASASHFSTAFDDIDDAYAHDEIEEGRLPEVVTFSRTLKFDERFNQAVGGLSAASLDLNNSEQQQEEVVNEEPAVSKVPLVESAQHVEFDVPRTEEISKTSPSIAQSSSIINPTDGRPNFFNYTFKTPLRQWQDISNISAEVARVTQAKVKAVEVAKVPPEVREAETAATPTLDMDMPKFLHEFSHHLPEPTFTSVDYEDLLDRTRLQAWLNTHTPEQILLYAQDAHDANYDDVAQMMLNDVLLRGNAEQCAAVLNLRYLWSYPHGVS